MPNLTNYHSHCSFCDGKAPLEAFVESAVGLGFTSYGVSSHAPLPFPAKWALEQERVGDYLAEIERLKKKYCGQIELYAAMEIDYLNEEQHPAIDYFQQLPLDYRIGSVHIVYTPEGKMIDTDTNAENFKQILERDFRGDLKQLVAIYFESSMRMLEYGGFDFVGHANKISYNVEQCDPFLTQGEWYKKKLTDFFALVAEKELRVEINTKAYLSKGCFFPRIENWKILKKFNIPIVVNSDAHRPELVNAGRMEALEALQEMGFRTVGELHAGKWVEMPLEGMGCNF